MTAQVLDGKALAGQIRAELTQRVAALATRGPAATGGQGSTVPGLGTVLVGDDPGSRAYVNGKHRDCAQVGIASIRRDLPADAAQAQVEAVVDELNADPACTGYIVQLPLPAGLDAHAVLNRMDPAKDADGLHPANLGKLVLTLYGALVVFALVALLPVALLSRVPLRRLLRAVKDPAIIAFTTTSSDAALPVAMERMIELGVPRRIVAFVVPTGYSFNLDGSTLYLGVASIFVAQAAGMHLALGTQLAMMLTLLVASKGVAGVPRASLVVLSGVLSGYGLPAEGVAVVLGVDELMDMARTTVNVVGNCLATVVIGRWEGELELAPEEARERAATFPALPSS